MYTTSLANNLVNSKSVRTCMFSVCKFLNSSKMRIGQTVASWVLAVCCFGLLKISQSQVPREEGNQIDLCFFRNCAVSFFASFLYNIKKREFY